MMRNDHQLEEIHNRVFDAAMEVESETQQATKKAASLRNLRARRAIESHFEEKELKRNLCEYDFD